MGLLSALFPVLTTVGAEVELQRSLCVSIVCFISSFDYNSPYIVSLGHGRIIPGMDRGLMGTCLWERRRITIPPHLGYGERGVGKIIPGNSTLVFYIRLIKIERVRVGVNVHPISPIGE